MSIFFRKEKDPIIENRYTTTAANLRLLLNVSLLD